MNAKPVNNTLFAIYSEAASGDFKINITLFLLTLNKSVLIKFENDHNEVIKIVSSLFNLFYEKVILKKLSRVKKAPQRKANDFRA